MTSPKIRVNKTQTQKYTGVNRAGNPNKNVNKINGFTHVMKNPCIPKSVLADRTIGV